MAVHTANHGTDTPAAVSGLQRSRFIYWLSISSSAILVLLTILCALGTRQFVSTIDVPIVHTVDRNIAQPLLVAAIKQLNHDQELTSLVSPGTNTVPPVDLQSIRNRLTYTLVTNTQTTGLTVQVKLVSNGTLRETGFMTRFGQALQQKLAFADQRPTSAAAGSTNPTRAGSDGAQSNVHGQRIAAVTSHFAAAFQALDALNQRIAVAKQSENDPTQSPSVGREQPLPRQVAFELDQLQMQQRELLGRFTATHPNVVELQQRIEDLKSQLDGLKIDPPANSPYQSASFRTDPEKNPGPDVSSWAEIDADELRQTMIALEQSWNDLALELQRNPAAGSWTTSPEIEANREPAVRTTATGLIGQRHFPVVITFLSLGLGVLVSLVASRRLVDRGFESPEELSTSLGLPIVGSLTATRWQSRRELQRDQQFRRVLKLSEMVLFITVLITIAIACRSPEIRQTLMENPVLGLCQVVWMIRG